MPQGLRTCRYHLLACFSHILARPPRLCQETLGPSVAVLERPVRPRLARVIRHNLLVPFLRVICLFRPPGCWPHEVLAAGGLVRGCVPVPVMEAGRQQVGSEKVRFSECTSGQKGCPDFPCAVALGRSVLVLHTVPRLLSHEIL